MTGTVASSIRRSRFGIGTQLAVKPEHLYTTSSSWMRYRNINCTPSASQYIQEIMQVIPRKLDVTNLNFYFVRN